MAHPSTQTLVYDVTLNDVLVSLSFIHVLFYIFNAHSQTRPTGPGLTALLCWEHGQQCHEAEDATKMAEVLAVLGMKKTSNILFNI